jgi:hypothetical protein
VCPVRSRWRVQPLADPGLQRFVKAHTLRSHKGPEGRIPSPTPLHTQGSGLEVGLGGFGCLTNPLARHRFHACDINLRQ